MLDYKNLNDVDLKLFLQSGGDIKVDNLIIKPYTLEEIKEYGYTNYIQNLQLISLSIDDFISSVADDSKREILEEQRDGLKTFDFYVSLGGQELLESLLFTLKMIFRTDDVRLLSDGMIAIDFVTIGALEIDEDGKVVVNEERFRELTEEEIKVIHRDNFDEVVEVVKLHNYLMKNPKNKKEEKYADEETRKLAEDMERHRKRVEEKKRMQRANDGEEEVDISDIISAVSSKSNSINKLNIWQFTLYQLYDEYSRLELIDNYNFSVRAIMAGAEKIDLRHWSSRL